MEIMRVPIESIQYLLDVFIEGGYAEDEDLEYIDDVYEWLEDEKHKKRLAFQKRTVRDVNPDYPSSDETHRSSVANHPGSPDPEWATEGRLWPNPLAQERAYPTDYPDTEEEYEEAMEGVSRGEFKITDSDGNEYFFTP